MKQTITKLLGGVFLAALCLVSDPASAKITATWDFANNNPTGIQSTSLQGESGEGFINSTIDGVQLFVNATSGKFAVNSGYVYIQMNANTEVRIPVVSTKDVVTINFAGNNTNCTINDVACSANPQSYTATLADVERGYVKLGATGGTYLNSISVDLAYLPAQKNAEWDFTGSGTIASAVVALSQTSKDETITVNGLDMVVNANGKQIGDNSNSIWSYPGLTFHVPVISTEDVVTVKGFKGYCEYTIDGGETITDAITKYSPTDADVARGYVEVVNGVTNYKYICSISVTQKSQTTATIGSYGWATFSNSSATDFTNLAGVVDAYAVTGASGAAITTSAVTTAAANTGLLLKAEAGTYAIPLAASGTDLSSTNLLKAGPATVNYNDGAGYNYVLGVNGSTAAFQKIVSGANGTVTVPAGKAYLALTANPGAPVLDITIDGISTGINTAREVQQTGDGIFYNLAGQRVAQPTKGLYIVNGKKIIIK